jgi:hypothetical protein
MQQYLKYRAADFLLLVCIAASLVFSVCTGFLLEDGLSSSPPVVFLLTALLEGCFFLFAYQRSTRVLGAMVGIALIVMAAVYARALHPMDNETENSLFVYLLLEVLVSLLVFFLCRSRLGTLVLLVVGSLLISGAAFLQFPTPAWCILVFSLSCGAMLLYRVYLWGTRQAVLGKIRVSRYVRQMILLVLCCGILAGGIFYLVIRPLSPPTQELRLITKLQSMEILERLGVASVKTVLDPTLSADVPPERTEYDNETAQQEDQEQDQQQEDWQEDLPETPETQPEQEAEAINYDLSEPNYWWLLGLIPLAIIGVFVGRVLYKRRWHRRTQGLSGEEQVVLYYHFFQKRLQKLGLGRTEFHTLREYAEETAYKMEAFQVEDITFAHLTGVYEAVIYGGAVPTEEELGQFEAFYGQFYRNLRREVGSVKYYLQVFRF